MPEGVSHSVSEPVGAPPPLRVGVGLPVGDAVAESDTVPEADGVPGGAAPGLSDAEGGLDSVEVVESMPVPLPDPDTVAEDDGATVPLALCDTALLPEGASLPVGAGRLPAPCTKENCMGSAARGGTVVAGGKEAEGDVAEAVQEPPPVPAPFEGVKVGLSHKDKLPGRVLVALPAALGVLAPEGGRVRSGAPMAVKEAVGGAKVVGLAVGPQKGVPLGEKAGVKPKEGLEDGECTGKHCSSK